MMHGNYLKKPVAFIVMIAVLFVMLFSCFYLSCQADHQCADTDCPVCAMIGQCINNLKQIGEAVVLSVCLSAFCVAFLLIKGAYNFDVSDNSLLSQKVRMNN